MYSNVVYIYIYIVTLVFHNSNLQHLTQSLQQRLKLRHECDASKCLAAMPIVCASWLQWGCCSLRVDFLFLNTKATQTTQRASLVTIVFSILIIFCVFFSHFFCKMRDASGLGGHLRVSKVQTCKRIPWFSVFVISRLRTLRLSAKCKFPSQIWSLNWGNVLDTIRCWMPCLRPKHRKRECPRAFSPCFLKPVWPQTWWGSMRFTWNPALVHGSIR